MSDGPLERWKESSNEHYSASTLFADDKAAGKKGFLGSLFSGGNIPLEDIQKDPGFIEAARVYYEQGSVGAPRSSDGVSDQEVVKKFISFLRWDKNNTSAMLANMARLSNASPELKEALAFGKDAFDLAKYTLGGTLRATVQTIADPLNLVGGGLALKVGLKVGGKALASQGIKFAAKGGLAKLGLRKGFQQGAKIAHKKAYKQAILNGASSQAASLAGRKARRQVIRQGIKIGVKYSAYEGLATGVIEDAGRQYTDFSLGRQKGWSFQKTFMTIGTSTLMGGVFTGLADVATPALGKGLKSIDNAYQGSALQRAVRHNRSSTGMFNVFGGGGRRAATPAGPPLSNSGLAVPGYERKIDWLKVWLRRTANPFTLFTKFAPLKNMDMECRDLVRPVFKVIDQIMGDISPGSAVARHTDIPDTSLIKKLQELEESILNDVDAGGANVTTLINDFAAANSAKLKEMHDDLIELRNHVDATFTTVEQLNVGRNQNMYYNAIFAGPHLRTGITDKKKKVLLSAIDEYINITADLQSGASGKYGTEMMDTVGRINSGMFTTDDIRGSGTRLSRANYLIDHSETGLTDKWARTDDAVNRQWSEKRVRGVQDEYHNPEHYENPVPWDFIRGENIEKNWQNQILTKYEEIAVKDADGNITSIQWKYPADVVSFEGMLTEAFNAGYGNEVQFMIRQLGRWRQKPGGKEVMTMPSSSNMLKAFEQTSYYKTDPKYKRWADNIVDAIKAEEIKAKGAAESAWWIGPFEHNRPNMHYYQSHKFPFEFTERWSGAGGTTGSLIRGSWAKPGTMYWRKSLIQHPFKKMWTWLLGAKTSKVDVDPQHGNVSVNVVWRDKEGKESWLSIPRRIAVRWLSLGLIDDLRPVGGIPVNPKFTTLGRYAAWSGGIYAGAEALDYVWEDNPISWAAQGVSDPVFRASTYYTREAYDVALFGDEEYNFLPFLDEDPEDDEGATIDGPESGGGGTEVEDDVPDSPIRSGSEEEEEETYQPTQPIHPEINPSDYSDIDASGSRVRNRRDGGSNWALFNSYAGAGGAGGSGGGGIRGALGRTGDDIMGFGGWLKDNLLDPIMGGTRNLYNSDDGGDGFGFLMAAITAIVSGKFIFNGGGIFGTLMTAAAALLAFHVGKGSTPGFGQGNGGHIPRMTSAGGGNYHQIGRVDIPRDMRLNDHSGSLSSIYINDNVEGLSMIDEDETSGDGDTRGVELLSDASTSATFRNVANERPSSDLQQNALLTAMSGEGDEGLVSGFTAMAGAGNHVDPNNPMNNAIQHHQNLGESFDEAAARFSVYGDQGDGSFTLVDMDIEEPFDNMDYVNSFEADANIVTLNVAKDGFGGAPTDPTMGRRTGMGMTA